MSNSKTDTIMAIVRLAFMFVSSILALCGVAMDANALYVIISCAVTAVAFTWSWWKNNNITTAASEAQEYLAVLKENAKNVEEE